MTNARTAKNAREKSAEMRAAAARAEARRRSLVILSAVVAVLVVAVGATILVRTASHEKAVQTAASTPSNLTDGGILVGQASAPVTITTYEDFQCPACKSFEDENAAQLDEWVKAGTVKVIYRPVSILDRYSSTEYSTRSLNAAASVVTASPTAFPAFHKLLFANQPAENTAGLTDAQLVDFAKQAGADATAVEAALAARTYDPWVAKVTEDFSKAGYTGTPTVLVNGTKLEDWSAASLADAVKKAQG